MKKYSEDELKERIKKSKRKYIRNKRKIERIFLLSLLGRICVKCGYDQDDRALQLDHIDGQGWKERRKHSNYTTWLNFYYKNPEIAKKKLQILCANCNAIKKIEMKEYGSHCFLDEL